jgi:hypothetical protein
VARVRGICQPDKVVGTRAPNIAPEEDRQSGRFNNKSHKDVQSILTNYFNTFTHIMATKAKPFPNGKQAQALIGHHDHRQPNLEGLTSPPLIPSVLPIKSSSTARTTTDPNARLGTAQSAQVRTSNDAAQKAQMRPSGRVARVERGAVCSLK